MSVTQKNIHLPAHCVLNEPELLFSCTNQNAKHVHPLVGLSQYGPFSASQLSGVPNPIRIGLLTPYGRMQELKNFITELNHEHKPKERKQYLIDYPGFASIFKTNIICADDEACMELPQDLDNKLSVSKSPHTTLVNAVTHALQTLSNVQHSFSVIFLMLPKQWEKTFIVKNESEDFNLHHHLKAVSASKNMPLQIINDDSDSALKYYCRCSVMWRISIALYTKAGGVPWTWANSPPDTAYIGLRYAMINRPDTSKKFAICCSQVFDANGSGLEFVAYEAKDVSIFGENPFLNRSQMLGVISRSIDIYQRKHLGKKPNHVVIHKNTEFKEEEIDGCFDALKSIDNVDLLHIKQDTSWNAVSLIAGANRNIIVSRFPCSRGTTMQLSGSNSLLWAHGNSASLSLKQNYGFYKGAKGIPSPLEIVRYAGHGSMDELCRSILALTKMDWNNDGPYVRLPVTLSYAHLMAQIVARMPKLESRPYPIRFFM